MKSKAFTLIELLVVVAIISILAAILFPVFSRARESARRTSCMSNVKQMALAFMQYSQDYDERLPHFERCGSVEIDTGISGWTGGSCGGSAQPWFNQLYPYIKSTQIFNCPSANYGSGTSDGTVTRYSGHATISLSYGYNKYLAFNALSQTQNSNNNSGNINDDSINLAAIPNVSTTPLVMDSAYFLTDPNKGCQNALANSWCTDAADSADAPLPRHLDTFNIAFADGHAKVGKMNDWVTPQRNIDCNNPIYVKWNPYCQS